MLPEKLLEVLKKDGVVAIATLGKDGPHMQEDLGSGLALKHSNRDWVQILNYQFLIIDDNA